MGKLPVISRDVAKFTPGEHTVFQALVLHTTSRETNLQAKTVNGKDEKYESKTFVKTHIRLSF